VAAPLAVLAIAVSGCSSSGSSGAKADDPVVTSTASVAAPQPDAGAQRVIGQAVAAVGRLRSYRFTASTTVAARQSVRSVLAGRVVRAEGIAYRLHVGHQTTQVVRTVRATYVRRAPGGWSKLRHPRPVVNPTASLRAVLLGLTATKVSAVGAGGHRVQGSLPSAAARKAGIPTDRRPADVVVTLDRRARVVGLTISTSTNAGTHSVTVTVRSVYSGFDRVARIVAPV
jgi:hypothetical protein